MYLGGQPGSMPGMPGTMGGMAHRSQPMYSASAKYREKEQFEETFPQPMGTQMRQHQAAAKQMRDSFQSMQSQMSARSNQMLMHETRHKYDNPEDMEEQYGRAALWTSGSLVLVAALGLLV